MKITQRVFLKPLMLAATLTITGLAQAKEFSILIYETPTELAKRSSTSQGDAYWNSYNLFAGSLAKAGVLRGGTALSEVESAIVKGRGGNKGAAKLGGYFVIDVENLDAAKKWAAQVPAAASAVEVWAHRPNPTMSAKPTVAP